MGQRTQHGYIFMLNLLLTPLLMVIGLIMSLVVMKVVGSMFAVIFPMAIADVQGNSWTGVFSIIGFCIIFCTTAVMIITNACDLIHHVPDTALTWIGGQNAQGMGKKMSDNFATATGALGAIMNNMGGKVTGTKGLTAAREKAASGVAAKAQGKYQEDMLAAAGGGGTNKGEK